MNKNNILTIFWFVDVVGSGNLCEGIMAKKPNKDKVTSKKAASAKAVRDSVNGALS